MKYLAVLFGLALTVLSSSAQVEVQINLDQEQFLPNERLVAHVRIVNSSGRTLHLGEEENWISFVIETLEGPFVKQKQLPEVKGGFDLQSSFARNMHINLNECFDLTRVGKYKILATVRVPELGSAYASSGKSFYIGSGSPLGEDVIFGVPPEIAPPGPDGKPELRKYKLVQTSPGQNAKLFLRVTDRLDQDIKVVQVGPLISFSRPEYQLDRWNNLHIFYQVGPRTFLYTMVNPEGMVLARETHDQTETRPILMSNDEGRIAVKGGNRRYTRNDIPPPSEPELLAAAPDIQDNSINLPPKETTAKKSKPESVKGSDGKEKKQK